MLCDPHILKENLIRQARNLEIGDRVEFHGFSPNISDEIAKSALLLNCSESESFSMICLEGLYLGTPVVTLNSGGPAEIVHHYETGLIFDLDESEEIIANEAVQLLHDKEGYLEMQKRGKQFAVDKFSIEDSVRKLEELYSKI